MSAYPHTNQHQYPPPQAGGYPPPQAGGYPPPQAGGYPPPQASYGFQGEYGQPGYNPVPQNAPYGQPIVQQPGGPPMPPGQQVQWMAAPGSIPDCPPGLEYLTVIDQLLIKQKVELLEVFSGFETNNKYAIKNSVGQNVYFAVEDNDCCTRQCCGSLRPFDMKIFDNYQHEVIHLYRKLACQGCCFPCCLQVLEVSSPPGNLLGTVEEEWAMCKQIFSIKSNTGEVLLRIEGPVCTISCCGDVDFDVLTPSGEKIGKISKQWRGFAKEMFTDADSFGINFPMDLDAKVKAILLGATFLIDFMYFEDNNNN